MKINFFTFTPIMVAMALAISIGGVRTQAAPTNAVAPVGHTLAHAVGSPFASRGAHMTHLPTIGMALSHWYFGTSNGQAWMQ